MGCLPLALPREKAMAPHSSTLAWKIPWPEEPGRLQSMGLLRVRHNWATSLSLFTFMHWRRKWQPTPVFLPRESQGRGSLVGCRLWVTQDRTWLKQLSSSSSSSSGSPTQEDLFISCCLCYCVLLFATPWTGGSSSMGFPRQEYWNWLPFSSPGDLPDPQDGTHVSCTAGRFFPIAPLFTSYWRVFIASSIKSSHDKTLF